MASVCLGTLLLLSIKLMFLPWINGETFCSLASCKDGSECEIEGNNVRCVCKPGFTNGRWNLSATTFTCSDIDECVVGNHLCAASAICENTKGSHGCVCSAGRKLWTAPTSYQHCTDQDVDICDTSIQLCGDGTLCISGPSSYACACITGYTDLALSSTGGKYQCQDVDECDTNTSNCGQGSVCENNPGSFECRCEPSLRLWSGPRGPVVCLASGGDVCETTLHVCGNGSVCQSNVTSGKYVCVCAVGYKELQETTNGFLVCNDVDECASSDQNTCNPETSSCKNTVGSFNCQCLPGYASQLGSDQICVDVNECSGVDPCQPGRDCLNTPGSYTCPCKEGYEVSATNTATCEEPDDVELIVGVSLSAIIFVVFLALLIAWFCRDKFKTRKERAASSKGSEQDMTSLSGRSEALSIGISPSSLLGGSSKSGSIKYQHFKANGFVKTSVPQGVYQVHTITERMVRSRRRQRQGLASTHVSRKSSFSQQSDPSYRQDYFGARTNGSENTLPVGGQAETKSLPSEDVWKESKDKGKRTKGVKAKGKAGEQTISAGKLPQDIVVTVESHIVTPTEKMFPASETSVSSPSTSPQQPASATASGCHDEFVNTDSIYATVDKDKSKKHVDNSILPRATSFRSAIKSAERSPDVENEDEYDDVFEPAELKDTSRNG